MFVSLPGCADLVLDFQGWDQALDVETAQGRGTLQPWSLGLHLPALASAAGPGEGGPVLDDGALAAAVLARCWSGPQVDGLDTVALWWAAAPGATLSSREGWIHTGTRRVLLRPWTWAERGQAVARCVSEAGLDLAAFLGAQVQTCVVECQPPVDSWESLPAGPVLAGLVELHRTPDLPPELGRNTLRAARALGWLPGAVLGAPAPEIDLLLRLLDGAEPTPAPRAAPVYSGLAAYPDAVVIRIEED